MTNYKALSGRVIIKADIKGQVSERESGLVVVKQTEDTTAIVAEILSVGDERDDLKVGMKILFPPNTGMKIEKNIFYLKYEDICVIVG